MDKTSRVYGHCCCCGEERGKRDSEPTGGGLFFTTTTLAIWGASGCPSRGIFNGLDPNTNTDITKQAWNDSTCIRND